MHTKSVLVSPDIYNDSLVSLKNAGFRIEFSFENKNVAVPLRYHIDMQLVKLAQDSFLSAPECYEYYSEILVREQKNVQKGNTYLSCNYPDDIAYNIIVGTDIAIHNFDYTDSVLKCLLSGKKLININQGYTACTVCALNDNAFITSDAGVYKRLKSDYDVLLINDDEVMLPGFNHGFFGGSSVMLADDILAVNGNAEKHKNYSDIKAFCLNYGINLLSLSDKPIMDIGSFIIV